VIAIVNNLHSYGKLPPKVVPKHSDENIRILNSKNVDHLPLQAHYSSLQKNALNHKDKHQRQHTAFSNLTFNHLYLATVK